MIKTTSEWWAARNSPLPDLPTIDAARTTCKTKKQLKKKITHGGTKRKSGTYRRQQFFRIQRCLFFYCTKQHELMALVQTLPNFTKLTSNVFRMKLNIKNYTVVSMADDGSWQRAKIPPFQPFCGTVIADYGEKTSNIGWYLPLWWAQKPPCISTIVPPWRIFDDTKITQLNSR